MIRMLLSLKDSRHPVIEKNLPAQRFVPNSIELDNEEQQMIIITGPNMAGKSTILRQVALICLMAQMGSFVPAQKAKIGLVDQIFTRVGASDDLSSGQSTFMVEMQETADILIRPPTGVWCSWMKSAGGPVPLTASALPGPWPNIFTT